MERTKYSAMAIIAVILGAVGLYFYYKFLNNNSHYNIAKNRIIMSSWVNSKIIKNYI